MNQNCLPELCRCTFSFSPSPTTLQTGSIDSAPGSARRGHNQRCHSRRTSSVQPLLKPHISSFLFPFPAAPPLAARSETIRPRNSHVAKPLCAIHCRPTDSAERSRFDRPDHPIRRFISHPKSPSHPLCVPPSSLLFLCVNLLPFPPSPLPLFPALPAFPRY